MLFSEKLKSLRRGRKMTQEELAAMLGVSCRTLQNYELGRSYPMQSAIYGKLSQIFSVSADYLLSDADRHIIKDMGGMPARDISELVSKVCALFEGGCLADGDKDAVMAALTQAYWQSKKINKKYAPKNR